MTRWLVPEELGHYEPVSRSLRIEGYSTSVRLERVFWDVLDQMAGDRGVSTCGLVSEIYRDVHASGEALTNFSSVLRVICLRHLECGAASVPMHPAPGRTESKSTEQPASAHGLPGSGTAPTRSRVTDSTYCPSCGMTPMR